MQSISASLLAYAEKQVEDSCDTKRKLTPEFLGQVCSLAERTAETLVKGGCVFFCGNGGSAADAQHLAAEFVGRFQIDRGALSAVSLVTNVSSLTAIANDFGYEFVFSRQVEALAKPGDILVLISTSGNSNNVLFAAEQARKQRVFTVGLTGASGGKLGPAVDLLLAVPSRETQRIQEAHILLGHIYCGLVEMALEVRKQKQTTTA